MKTEKKERRGEECGRMSICSPPKNALLLMRCRSDPVKVAALANGVRERQLSLNDGALGGRDEEDDDRRRFDLDLEDKKRIELCDKWFACETTVEINFVVTPETEASSNPTKEEEAVEDLAVEEEEEVEIDSFEEEIEANIIKTIEEDYIWLRWKI